MRRTLMLKTVLVAIMIGCLAQGAFAAGESALQIKALKPGANVEIDRILGPGKALVSVLDADKKVINGLGAADFEVTLAERKAKILSAQPLSESRDVPRHIVMVLDNSDSMRQRKAVDPLLSGVGEVLKTIRPIDDVQIVVFSGTQTMNVGGRNLHVKTIKSNQKETLQAFVAQAYKGGITDTTVLYEAMLAGLDLVSKMPADDPKFMVIFSDGEDINSVFKSVDVMKASQGKRFNAYAIDYMPGPQTDKFLSSFATQNHGQIFKAASETSFVSIFQGVASQMQQFYIVSYVLAQLKVIPDNVTIEEIKTIDASPMLAQIFFAEDSSEIPATYVRLAGPADTAAFDEQKFSDTLEKYYQVLNIIGKRMTDKPDAKLTLVGCNANMGKETGKKKLSTKRAEALRDYLQQVWNVSPERITIQARNLPAMPSASRLKEGQAENRRVEIQSSDPAILAPIKSVYFASRTDTPTLKVNLNEVVPQGIDQWKLSALNAGGTITEVTGKGKPGAELQIPMPSKNLKSIGQGGDMTLKLEIKDSKGNSVDFMSDPVKVKFIQTSELLAQKQDMKVQEKYALILFDFNKDTIGPNNKAIVDQVATRIKHLPQATTQITGHTDNIGKEAYNVKLSERRAKAVYKLLFAASGEEAGERIHFEGVGPNTPLYDNTTPEARSFNRTVTITLEYQSAQ